jgi:transcription termination/antitermination protein NusG
MEPEMKWYVVHTYSGYENKVMTNLKKRVESMEMQEKIFRVLVPMQDEIVIKDGKQKLKPQKVFPGYVLVEMIMGDDSWYVVRNTPGVTGFVGANNRPIPLTEEEVRQVLGEADPNRAPEIRVEFDIGQAVVITAGAFKDHQGVVREIHAEKGKAVVSVEMFGRETPVEVDLTAIAEV